MFKAREIEGMLRIREKIIRHPITGACGVTNVTASEMAQASEILEARYECYESSRVRLRAQVLLIGPRSEAELTATRAAFESETPGWSVSQAFRRFPLCVV